MQMQSEMEESGGRGMGGMPGMGGMGLNPFAPPGAAQGGGEQQPPTDPFPNLFAPNAGQTPSTGTNNAVGNTTGGAGDQTTGTGGGGGNPPPNPFAALFGQPGAGGQGVAGMNPFGFDSSMMFGGGAGGGGSPWGAPAPRYDRPPEEIYQTQLGQLNAMVSVLASIHRCYKLTLR